MRLRGDRMLHSWYTSQTTVRGRNAGGGRDQSYPLSAPPTTTAGCYPVWRRVLLAVIDRYRNDDIPKFFRGEAGEALYEFRKSDPFP